MFKRTGRLALMCSAVAMALASAANAQVGEPQGTYTITVRQGGSVIANDTFTVGPGGDLSDLKANFQDGDPESFTQIGTIGPGANPIILKMTSDDDPNFRITHWYIDVPVSTADIYSPGPTSLFNPLGGTIDVTISASFANGAAVIPFVVDNNSFFTSFMRDWEGHFYASPLANSYNSYGNGVIDVQVPGQYYKDAGMAYDFVVNSTGTTSSWTWNNILNPGLATDVVNQFGAVIDPNMPGYVFELGLAVAFVQVPEPGTLAMALPAVFMAIRRRRRR